MKILLKTNEEGTVQCFLDGKVIDFASEDDRLMILDPTNGHSEKEISDYYKDGIESINFRLEEIVTSTKSGDWIDFVVKFKDASLEVKLQEEEHIKLEQDILEIMDSELSIEVSEDFPNGIICNRFSCASKIAEYIKILTK